MAAAHRRLLPSHPRAAAQARRFIAEKCRHLPRRTIEAALLLTSELVGNAVRHGRPDVAMSVDCSKQRLHVEVEDGSPDLPQPRTPSPTAETGRGLLLVQAYADRWGVRALQHGKVVWFTLGSRTPSP